MSDSAILSMAGAGRDPDPCSACTIRHSSLCGALSSEEIRDLSAIARRKVLDAGQPHVMEGDLSGDFANVTQGVAKMVCGAEDGRSQIVGLLFPSDFIAGALGDRDPTTARHSIEAITELQLCIFPRRQFEEVLHEHPSLEFKLLKRTLDELQLAREWMVLLGRKTAEERVASFLVHVSQKMENLGCQGRTSFDLPLSRTEIADYIGLTLETVSRQITRLRKDGVIAFEGSKRVISLDRQELEKRAGF
ncbi:MAG: Crp/Fnr family transcriptional regulator [Pseudomonadota bacterium]